jgi:hypothetical protein
MHNPVRALGVLWALRHGVRAVEPSISGYGSGRFWRRSAIVLLGVALLGAASAVREFDISIRDRRVEGGTSTIRVKRGETILMRWRTDESVVLHVHGYDLQASVSPGSSSAMRFEAGVAGRFRVTAHAFGAVAGQDARAKKPREITLLYLEVLPE